MKYKNGRRMRASFEPIVRSYTAQQRQHNREAQIIKALTRKASELGLGSRAVASATTLALVHIDGPINEAISQGAKALESMLEWDSKLDQLVAIADNCRQPMR